MGKPLPAKKPPDQVRRRNTTLVTNLPPEGRTERAPKWPLPTGSVAEKARWKELWAMPQAVIWEQWHLERVVARYVRVALKAEKIDAPTTTMAEARRFEVELGLTPKAILGLQWTLATGTQISAAPVSALDAYREAAS